MSKWICTHLFFSSCGSSFAYCSGCRDSRAAFILHQKHTRKKKMALVSNDKTQVQKWNWKTNVAAFTTGMVAKTIIAPLDQIKLTNQVREGKSREIWKTEDAKSLTSLFRGNLIRSFKSGVFTSLQLPLNKYLRIWTGVDVSSPLLSQFSVALGSSLIAQTCTHPLDQMSQWWTLSTKKSRVGLHDPFKGVSTSVRSPTSIVTSRPMVRVILFGIQQGKLWQGYTSCMAAAAPFNTILFILQPNLQHACSKYGRAGQPLSKMEKAMTGGLSAVLTSLMTYSLDTARHNVQQWSHPTQKAPWLIPMTVQIWKKHGLRGLYWGFGSSVLKSAVTHTLRFGLFDPFESWLSSSTSHFKIS